MSGKSSAIPVARGWGLSFKEIVPVSEKHREIVVDPVTREKVLQVSAATIDRILKEERKKWQVKGIATTEAQGHFSRARYQSGPSPNGTRINEGFIEVDLVGHDGGDPEGIYIQTLTATDIFTGWTETEAVKNKARISRL